MMKDLIQGILTNSLSLFNCLYNERSSRFSNSHFLPPSLSFPAATYFQVSIMRLLGFFMILATSISIIHATPAAVARHPAHSEVETRGFLGFGKDIAEKLDKCYKNCVSSPLPDLLFFPFLFFSFIFHFCNFGKF